MPKNAQGVCRQLFRKHGSGVHRHVRPVRSHQSAEYGLGVFYAQTCTPYLWTPTRSTYISPLQHVLESVHTSSRSQWS